MKIAVLGSGYSGLAVSWFLLALTQGKATIDIFDPVPLGGGASGLSSGLLHTFPGYRALKPKLADRCLEATHSLITAASKSIKQPIVISKGILRPAFETEQINLFQTRASEYPGELEWWDRTKCETKVIGLTLPEEGGGLFIPGGLTLDNDAYLDGLWNACASMGTQLYDELIENLDDIKDFYDQIIITAGANCDLIPSMKNIPTTKNKGQILEVKWPEELPKLPFSINSRKYMVAGTRENNICILGSTFEHNQIENEPDPEVAKQEILEKLLPIFPALSEAEILNCYSGFRCSSPTKKPLIGKTPEGYWFLLGLGSKGLLYHALCGEMLAQSILANTLSYVDLELLYSAPQN
ncbi:MAG: FAD-dependent oxidoreductase [Victivallaceae bacterium]